MEPEVDKVSLLKRVSFFSEASDDVLDRVAAILTPLNVIADTPIIVAGEMETTMYILVEGQVRVHIEGQDITAIDAPDVFGELSALDPAPRSASVTATSDAQLLALSHE